MNSYKDCIYFIFLYSVGKNQRNATSVTLHSLRQAIWGFMITWILRLPAWENAKSHLLHFFDFFPLCAFKWVLKLPASVDRKSHWLHLIGFSLELVFKCILKMSSWADAKSHWFYLFDLSPLCVFKCLLKWPASERAESHWLHLFDFSPLCIFKCLLKSLPWEDASMTIVTLVVFFCSRRCIITIIAFVWLFPTVHFQMLTQRVWIRAGKVTLVAFV